MFINVVSNFVINFLFMLVIRGLVGGNVVVVGVVLFVIVLNEEM